MGIYLRGMEMPKACYECDIEDEYYFRPVNNRDTDEVRATGRHEDCPLVEIKEPHGNLIDMDELKKSVLKWLPSDPCGVEERERPFETDICASMMMEIEEQTIVIKAE